MISFVSSSDQKAPSTMTAQQISREADKVVAEIEGYIRGNSDPNELDKKPRRREAPVRTDDEEVIKEIIQRFEAKGVFTARFAGGWLILTPKLNN